MTSAVAASLRKTACPSGDFMFSVMDRLLRLTKVWIVRRTHSSLAARPGSGVSILRTSAPMSASIIAGSSAGATRASSRSLIPSSARISPDFLRGARKSGLMRALDGIRILELARVAPAELPAMMLADMGAEVLKIETPEPGRAASDEWVRRTIHTFVNRNKRSMTLNMKSPEGQAVFRKLAATADVIVEGFRPGVMKRLGADYDTLSRLNPRLVYCSLSGFGQDGPYRNYPAHDMNYLSLAGVLNLIGEPDRKPVTPLNLVADYAGASLHGALGIMLARSEEHT